MADIFAVLRNDEIRRLNTSRDLQETLVDRFTTGATALRSNILDYIPLDASGFQPDETEALIVQDFELPGFMAAAFENPIGCPLLNQSEIEDVGVRALAVNYSGERNPWVAFQVRDSRDILSRQGLNLILERGAYRRLESPGIMVGDDVHVVFENGQLVFKSLWWAGRVFDLSAHFKAATDDDIREFIGRPEISVSDAATFLASCGHWERKRIGAILASGLFDHVGVAVIKERAAEYEVALDVNADGDAMNIVIPEDRRHRKEILQFLEEKLYRGPLTETAFVASSRRPRRRT